MGGQKKSIIVFGMEIDGMVSWKSIVGFCTGVGLEWEEEGVAQGGIIE